MILSYCCHIHIILLSYFCHIPVVLSSVNGTVIFCACLSVRWRHSISGRYVAEAEGLWHSLLHLGASHGTTRHSSMPIAGITPCWTASASSHGSKHVSCSSHILVIYFSHSCNISVIILILSYCCHIVVISLSYICHVSVILHARTTFF